MGAACHGDLAVHFTIKSIGRIDQVALLLLRQLCTQFMVPDRLPPALCRPWREGGNHDADRCKFWMQVTFSLSKKPQDAHLFRADGRFRSDAGAPFNLDLNQYRTVDIQ